MATKWSQFDERCMRRALELAARGEGAVEPNPMVGCVVAAGDQLVAEGMHARFGAAHAEVVALRQAGSAARQATLYVTLEPCCHHGKTPPCSQAILRSGVSRVVVAQRDPFPQVAGQGIAELQAAGVLVEEGLLAAESRRLNAPYHKLQSTGCPWVIGKWAMSLDGKIATARGESQWISNAASRRRVHQLRGRMDAIVVGRGTAAADDPLLTARPPGPREAIRVVLDSQARLSLTSQLVTTARTTPVIVATGPRPEPEKVNQLRDAGCEVWVGTNDDPASRLDDLLQELGRRNLTNVLVEGGGQLLGSLTDARAIDEVHVFIAPRLIGGQAAPSPVAGVGIPQMELARTLSEPQIEFLDGDVYVRGRFDQSESH